MGAYFSSYFYEADTGDLKLLTKTGHGRKRKNDSDSALDDANTEEDSLLHTPRKKKLKSTTDYIYQVLFVEGENSDVTITALGKEWKLHKLYLKQCGYFDSMFNGSWKESGATSIALDIPDSNIDAEALSVAFGCLYRDDLTIEPVQVVPVVAASCLLQLDGLMHQCAAIMKETISTKTACEYYECSVLYGLTTVTASCFEWFEHNIMCKQSKSLLKGISCKLMRDLIKSSNLFVMQVEMDVYNLLKRWLYLQLVPWWNGSYKKDITKHAENHFKDLTQQEFGSGTKRTFLETTQGKSYRPVFAALRFQHIVIDLTSTNLLFKDKVIPKEWLMPYFQSQWLTMLTVEQGDDSGPKNEEVDSDVFLEASLRCARILNKDVEHQWRWIGFNYGIDLVVMYTERTLIFKRNCTSQSRLLSNQSKRNVMLRLTASCLNDLGQVTYSKTSGIVSHDLVRDGQVLGLSIDRKATMPLRIALNIMYCTPKPAYRVQNLVHIPLRHNPCQSCKGRNTVAAIAPSASASFDNGAHSEGNTSAGEESDESGSTVRHAAPSSVGSSDGAASDDEEYAALVNPLA